MSRELDIRESFLFIFGIAMVEKYPTFVQHSLVVDILPPVPISTIVFVDVISRYVEIPWSSPAVQASITWSRSIFVGGIFVNGHSVKKLPKAYSRSVDPSRPSREGVLAFASSYFCFNHHTFRLNIHGNTLLLLN